MTTANTISEVAGAVLSERKLHVVTAYCHYAQIVEGLACDDDLYLATSRARAEYAEAQADWERVEEGGRIRVLPKRKTA